MDYGSNSTSVSQPPSLRARGPLPSQRGHAVPPRNTRHIPFPTPGKTRPKGGCSGAGHEEAVRGYAYAKAILWLCLSSPSAGEGHNIFLLEPKPALAGGDFPPAACAACSRQRSRRSRLHRCPPPHKAGRFCSAPNCNPPPGRMQQPFKHGPVLVPLHCDDTQHCSREKRGADLSQSALSRVGEQINQARGLADKALTSYPGNGKGKTQSFSLMLVPTPRGSAGFIHQHCSSSSSGRAGGRTVAIQGKESRFLFQDKLQHGWKEDSVSDTEP